jgi:hypothetical protein
MNAWHVGQEGQIWASWNYGYRHFLSITEKLEADGRTKIEYYTVQLRSGKRRFRTKRSKAKHWEACQAEKTWCQYRRVLTPQGYLYEDKVTDVLGKLSSSVELYLVYDLYSVGALLHEHTQDSFQIKPHPDPRILDRVRYAGMLTSCDRDDPRGQISCVAPDPQ